MKRPLGADNEPAQEEKRHWRGAQNNELYSKQEWVDFAIERGLDCEKLWSEARTVLCHQPVTTWHDVLNRHRTGESIVMMVSCRRAYVDALKVARASHRNVGRLICLGNTSDNK